MAVHYYNLKVVMCRERGDTKAVGSKTYSESTREEWNFTFTSSDTSEGTAKGEFLSAMEDAFSDAPQHIKSLTKSGGINVPGSLRSALSNAATIANDEDPGVSPWSERVGKDVFRYEIGVSATSAAEALSKRTAHDLS